MWGNEEEFHKNTALKYYFVPAGQHKTTSDDTGATWRHSCVLLQYCIEYLVVKQMFIGLVKHSAELVDRFCKIQKYRSNIF